MTTKSLEERLEESSMGYGVTGVLQNPGSVLLM